MASTPAYQLAFQAALKNLDQKKFPPLGSSEEIYDFFLRMHEILRNHYGMYVTFQQGQEFEWSPMNAVLANQSGIYRIDSSRSVIECTKFAAIGSGKDLAIGAVAALYKTKKSAKQLIEAAFAVTIEQELLHPDAVSVRTVKSPGLKVTSGRAKSKRSSSSTKKKSLKPVKGGKK
jgi:20S proteasome alpha/beta subunit